MSSKRIGKNLHSQNGATLLVSLIMLVVITLMVVTSFNIGNSNLKIVNNAQDKQRASALAEGVLNNTINTIQAGLVSDPCDVTALTAEDGSTTVTEHGVEVTLSRAMTRTQCVTNGAVLTPWKEAGTAYALAQQQVDSVCGDDPDSSACATAKAARDIKKSEKDVTGARAVECTMKRNSGGNLILLDPATEGGEGDPELTPPTIPTDQYADNSYCVDVVMELRADAEDVATGARSTVMRGVALHCSNHDVPESGC